MTEQQLLNMVEVPYTGHQPGLEPLVVIHGLFGSGDNWMSLARKWAQKRSVFLVDLPNHGGSPWTSSIRYEEMARLLDATLADRFPQGQEINLLGHSMGGKLAMTTALLADKLSAANGGAYAVTRLVVADIAPRRYPPGHEEIIAALQGLDLDRVENRGDADRLLSQQLPDKMLRAFLLKNLSRHEDASFGWKLNIDLIAEQYDEVLAWDAEGSSAVSTLFLKGGKSPYIQLPRDREVIWTLFPRTRLEVVQGAGHWLHAEKPDEVVSLVEDFLGAD